MIEEAKWINVSQKRWVFSWWYVDNVANYDLADYYSPYLRNCRLEWQSIIIRPWHSLFATLATWSYPKWIWSYLRASSANDVLVVRHNQDTNKKLVTITEAWTITAIDTSTNITSDNRMTFSNIWDVIYCMNWVDNFWKLNWTTYTLPSTWVTNFAPSFAVSFAWSHWASWWSTNPNIVYKSVADNYEDFNSTWADTFKFSETITWLSANLEALFYFTKNSISVTWLWDITDTSWVLTFANRALNVKEWAINHSSIVEAWTRTFYLTPSNKICQVAKWQSIDWFEVLELSERKYQWISEIMNTLDKDQTASFWYFLPKENLVKWHLKTQWASFNDICIIYDLTKDAFLVDSQKFFYDWVSFKGYNYTISTIENKVYKDEYWQDDEDSPIPFVYWTKEFYIWDPTYKKILWETRTLLDINELAELKQEIWIDWWLQDTKTVDKDNIPIVTAWLWTTTVWVTAIWTSWLTWYEDLEETYILRTKWNLNKKWRKFQFRYTNNTLAWKVRLKNISMLVEMLPWLATNLTT